MSTIFAIIGWLISLFRRPTLAEKLGRTEEEVANAYKALQEIQNAQAIKAKVDAMPADELDSMLRQDFGRK